jgi:hypothetical protein
MQPHQGIGQAFVIACQTAKTRHPAKGTLDHLTRW